MNGSLAELSLSPPASQLCTCLVLAQSSHSALQQEAERLRLHERKTLEASGLSPTTPSTRSHILLNINITRNALLHNALRAFCFTCFTDHASFLEALANGSKPHNRFTHPSTHTPTIIHHSPFSFHLSLLPLHPFIFFLYTLIFPRSNFENTFFPVV
jgi:hypothetical protein